MVFSTRASVGLGVRVRGPGCACLHPHRRCHVALPWASPIWGPTSRASVCARPVAHAALQPSLSALEGVLSQGSALFALGSCPNAAGSFSPSWSDLQGDHEPMPLA